MQGKHAITALLLLFVVGAVAFLIYKEVQPAPNPDATALKESGEGHKVVAYYFHGNMRCPTCVRIQDFAKEALENAFAPALADGQLEFREVNFDLPENAHFVRDFELSTSSLVLVDFHDGEAKDWKLLEKTWSFVRDKDAFFAYVREETQAYLNAGAP